MENNLLCAVFNIVHAPHPFKLNCALELLGRTFALRHISDKGADAGTTGSIELYKMLPQLPGKDECGINIRVLLFEEV